MIVLHFLSDQARNVLHCNTFRAHKLNKHFNLLHWDTIQIILLNRCSIIVIKRSLKSSLKKLIPIKSIQPAFALIIFLKIFSCCFGSRLRVRKAAIKSFRVFFLFSIQREGEIFFVCRIYKRCCYKVISRGKYMPRTGNFYQREILQMHVCIPCQK